MDILPILTTLRRHKTAAALIVLEIALSCAIICNAVFMIGTRVERMQRETGVAESELVRVQVTGIGTDDNAAALTKTDLAALRAIPGVRGATVAVQVPFGNSSWNSSVNLSPDQTHSTLNAALYLGDEALLETLGVRFSAGRDFNANEYIDSAVFDATNPSPALPVILTRVVAEKLFPGESAVGKSIYVFGNVASPVVGVIEHLARPNEQGGPAEYGYSMVFPIRMPYHQGNFLLRTDPARRAEVLKAAVATLDRNNPNRIVLKQDTLEDLRERYYRQDRSMAWLLVSVCIALLVVTALGIVGLASFWVQQRTKQIGIRRALGATRGQILRYFQTENFVLATLGIAIGMMLAYGINLGLMSRYELPRLPAIYLPVGALALWLLGQIAVFGPARRAAAVPPAVATRSV